MAELFMECEEEELEPWQQKTKPIVEDDEDDEPIFVGEFLSAKPTNTYILNRVNPNSSRVGMQNGVPKRAGAVAVPSGFHGVSKPTMSTLAVHPQPRASNVSGAPQALQRPLSGCSSPQEGATSGSGTSQPVTQPATPQSALRNLPVASCAQPVSRPVATVTAQPVASDRVTSNKTSGLAFGGRQNSGGKPCQSGSPTNATGLSKRPATSEASSVTAKKVKANEADSERELSLLPLSKAPNDTSLIQKDVALSNFKNGASFPQACPKCNIHFNLLEPLKNHIKYCCPDMGISKMDCSGLAANTAESEKGKLIMLVNDFYYGKHEGNTQQVRQEQKTHTTFKCASCTKVLKSNLRFMNHMKHHLEVEKQNNESWESHTTCQHCYRQFPTPFQLQCHIESTHTPHESSTVCKICELSFETEQVLLQHMKDNHKPGEMPYVCQVCNYRSSVFSDVEKHFRAVHENTKNLLCPFCLKVIKIGATYMHHFMKHQKKGVHRCTKCRLQFLTCKEKLDHKSQHHRTFKKPAQLEGLPPGTKVTIRASVGSLQPVSVMASPLSANASTLQLSPGTKEANGKTQSRCNARKTKSRFKLLNLQKNQMLSQNSISGSTSSKKANKIANTALNNLRCPDIQKCIECYSDIRTFASHFPAYVRCSLCRYSTSCSKAYVNHMVCFHTARQNKRFWIYKAHAEELRGTTVVCLNCDFLTDVSGLDKMATHLNENHSHTCQVIVEKVPLDNLTAADFSDLAKDEEEKPEICTEPPTQKEQAEASISGSPQTTSPKETKVNIPEKQNNDSAFAEETKQLVPKNNFSPDFQAYSNNSAERGKTEGLGNQDMLVAECELKKSSILENISGPEPEACSEHCAEESGADKMKNQIQKDLLAVDGKGDDPLPATGDTSVSELHSCFTQELANQESASLSASENAGTVQVPGASCGLESASPKSPTGECLANRMGDDDAPDPEHNTCSGELPNSENTQDADCLTSQNQSDACSLVAKDEGNTSSGEEKFSALILSASSNGPADSADEPNKDKIEETNPTSPAPQCKENISVEEPVAELQAAPKISAAEKARDPLGNPTGVTEESSASSTVKNVSTSGLQASSAESSCEVSVPENNKANDDQSSVVQTKGTDWDEAQLADVNDETTELASGDDEVSFEQFLRRRGEPESAHSDASDQGSVHLEPLTPSEVLEHEATEILQKGAVPATSKKAGVGSEPADGPSGEDSPSQEEPSEGGDEAS